MSAAKKLQNKLFGGGRSGDQSPASGEFLLAFGSCLVLVLSLGGGPGEMLAFGDVRKEKAP